MKMRNLIWSILILLQIENFMLMVMAMNKIRSQA